MNLNTPGYTGTSGLTIDNALNNYTVGSGGGLTTTSGLNIPAPGTANIPAALAASKAGQSSPLGTIASGIGDIFGGITDIGKSAFSSPNTLMGLAGGLLTKEAYDRLSQIGDQAKNEAMEIARRSQEESRFKPFTVTTPTQSMFTTRVGEDGGVQVGMQLSPEEQALQQQLMQGGQGFFGQATQPMDAREQAIMERIRAAQRPEEERQRLALEERLAAQGRLGTSSAAYGGATPEQLALATAQEEAKNRAMLTAMQQAQAEQLQQANLGQSFLGASYMPQMQLIEAARPGLIQQELAQQAQQFGTGLFGETALSGIESQLIAEQARANLLGGIGSNIIQGLMNQQTGTGSSSGKSSGLGGLFSGIVGGIEKIGSGLGGLIKI